MLKAATGVVERFLLKNNYGNRIIPTQLSQPSGDFFVKDNEYNKFKPYEKLKKVKLNQLIYVFVQILFVPDQFGPSFSLLPFWKSSFLD